MQKFSLVNLSQGQIFAGEAHHENLTPTQKFTFLITQDKRHMKQECRDSVYYDKFHCVHG